MKKRIQSDIYTLIERINRRDPSLSEADWHGMTYDYDMDILEFVYQHIEDEEMLDIVTTLICSEYRRLLLEGKIEIPTGVSGYPNFDQFELTLESFANERRNLLSARRKEEEVRKLSALKIKIGKMRKGKKGAEDTSKKSKDFNRDLLQDILTRTNRSIIEKKSLISTLSGPEGKDFAPKAANMYLSELSSELEENSKMLLEAYDASHESIKPDVETLAEDFKTPEAEKMMQKLVDACLLTSSWQPQELSIAERGYLAGEIGSRLKIKAKWKVLGQLWNENPETLRQGNNRAIGQAKTSNFIDKLKKILG